MVEKEDKKKFYSKSVNPLNSQIVDLRLENGILKEQIKDAEKEHDLLIKAIDRIKFQRKSGEL